MGERSGQQPHVRNTQTLEHGTASGGHMAAAQWVWLPKDRDFIYYVTYTRPHLSLAQFQA
eukprot:2936712-Amphidinium_carterae.1